MTDRTIGQRLFERGPQTLTASVATWPKLPRTMDISVPIGKGEDRRGNEPREDGADEGSHLPVNAK